MKIKLGIIREGKIPQDNRVPLSPPQCKLAQRKFPLDIVVQPSDHRCFSDDEYKNKGIRLTEDLSDCQVLLGVKEVPIPQLLADKNYFFFSHTIKKQSYNRKLLQNILAKNIKLIDYETITDDKGNRVIAFGKFAGMVGAHNALWAYGERTSAYKMKRMHEYNSYREAKKDNKSTSFPPFKIVLTGTGRVSGGAALVLKDAGIKKVTIKEFLKEKNKKPVFVQLGPKSYVKRKDGKAFGKLVDFFKHPQDYSSRFSDFWRTADIMINGIYWDPKSPAFFSKENMYDPAFQIKLISDITCDIAPESSIPSTIRPSTISDPIYGFDPKNGKEIKPYKKNGIDVVAIDNLPNELSRDASMAFGRQFIGQVLPELCKKKSKILEKATIAENGKLGSHYTYLSDYVKGK